MGTATRFTGELEAGAGWAPVEVPGGADEDAQVRVLFLPRDLESPPREATSEEGEVIERVGRTGPVQDSVPTPSTIRGFWRLAEFLTAVSSVVAFLWQVLGVPRWLA